MICYPAFQGFERCGLRKEAGVRQVHRLHQALSFGSRGAEKAQIGGRTVNRLDGHPSGCRRSEILAANRSGVESHGASEDAPDFELEVFHSAALPQVTSCPVGLQPGGRRGKPLIYLVPRRRSELRSGERCPLGGRQRIDSEKLTNLPGHPECVKLMESREAKKGGSPLAHRKPSIAQADIRKGSGKRCWLFAITHLFFHRTARKQS